MDRSAMFTACSLCYQDFPLPLMLYERAEDGLYSCVYFNHAFDRFSASTGIPRETFRALPSDSKAAFSAYLDRVLGDDAPRAAFSSPVGPKVSLSCFPLSDCFIACIPHGQPDLAAGGSLLNRRPAQSRGDEANGVFTIRLDEGLTLQSANDSFYEMHGVTKETMLAQYHGRYAECIHPEDLSRIRPLLNADGAKSEASVQFGLRIITSAPDEKYLFISGAPFYDGGVRCFSGVSIDYTDEKQTEQNLLAEQEFTSIALSATNVSIWKYDHRTNCILCSPSSYAVRCGGMPPVIENVPESLIESGHVQPEDAEAFREMYHRLLSGEPEVEGTFRVRRPADGKLWYEHIRYTNLFDCGKPFLAIATSEDVTRIHEAKRLFEHEMQLMRVMGSDTLYTAILDASCWELVQQQCRDSFDLPSVQTAQDLAQYLTDSVESDETTRSFYAALSPKAIQLHYEAGRTAFRFEYRQMIPGGSPLWVRADLHIMEDPESARLMLFLCIKDINVERMRYDALAHAAEADSMTDLLNHDATFDHIRRFLAYEGRRGRHALFMIDIDNFKAVNDRLGHQKGDAVICDVAAAIRRAFRTDDIVGRIGGDEFLALMKNVSSVAVVRKKAAELVNALEFNCSQNGCTVEITGSIGISIYAGNDISVDLLYRMADASLYRAKADGKNCYALSETPDGLPEDAEENGVGAEVVQLRTLLEYMDGGVLIIEVEKGLRIVYASPSLFTGPRTAEFSSDYNRLMTLIHPEDLPELKSAARDAVQSGSVFDRVFRTKSDGVTGWLHIRGVRLPGAEDEPPKLICVLSDITEFKKTSARFEAIFNNTPDGIGIFSFDGERLVETFTNDRLRNAVRRDIPNYFDTVETKDLPVILAEIRKSLEENRPFNVSYSARYGADNAMRHVQARGVKLYSEGSELLLLIIFTDVTHEKAMAEQLRIAETRYRTAIEVGDLLMFEADIPNRSVRHYGSIAKELGFSGRTFLNAPDSILLRGSIHSGSEAEYRRMFDDIYAGRPSGEYIVQSIADDGHGVWTAGHYQLLKDDQGQPVFAIGVSTSVPNIEAEMRAFEREQHFLDFISPLVLGAVSINLSKDRVESISHDFGERLKVSAGASFSQFQHLCGDFADTEEERKNLNGGTSIQSLLAAYQSGEKWRYLDYACRFKTGEIHYLELTIHFQRHPVTGEIYAYFYCRDVDVSHRWALSAGKPLEHSSISLLLTKESFSSVVSSAIKTGPGEQLCAFTVIELTALRHIQELRGIHFVNDILFALGRLCRFMVTGSVLTGQLDDGRVGFFRMDVASASAQQRQTEQMRLSLQTAMQQNYPGLDLALTCGYTIAKLSDCDFDTLLRRASTALEASVRLRGQPVSAYMEAQDGGDAAVFTSKRRSTVLLACRGAALRGELAALLQEKYNVYDTDSFDETFTVLNSRDDIAAALIDTRIENSSRRRLIRSLHEDHMLTNLPLIAISAAGAQAYTDALEDGALDAVSRPFVKEVLFTRVAGAIARGGYARIYAQNRSYELQFQHQANLLRLSDYDDITGIYNKNTFYRLVREQLDARRDEQFLIARWDLDNFKVFNDALGFPAGDKLLHDIGSVLKLRSDSYGIYAHLESDHFVSFLPANEDLESLFQEISQWLSAYPAEFRLTCRMGVYRIDDPGLEVSTMCDRALLALRSIKGSYTKRLAYYQDTLRSQLLEEQQLISEVMEALESERFEIFFQPQCDYETGAIIGAEALVRWNHPTKGILSPGRFVPLFERNGFISELDAYVWEKSCQYMRRWLDDVDRLVPVSVAVNISRLDIYNPHLCENLQSLVRKYGLPLDYLKLEITESAYIENPKQLIEVVSYLQKAGFTVEMDDFGSGYSSLNTLKDVPVDTLKLDMKFLTDCLSSTRGSNLLCSVVRMAHWLELPIIAEGVETREQAEYLKSLGCRYMQGFYFAKPMPAAEFEKVLISGKLARPLDAGETTLRYANEAIADATRLNRFFELCCTGAAIVELRGGGVELLRANDRFFEALHLTREAYAPYQIRMLDRFDAAGRSRFLAMLQEADAAEGTAVCETESLPLGGCVSFARVTARVLAIGPESSVYLLSVEDRTEAALLQKRLNALNASAAN